MHVGPANSVKYIYVIREKREVFMLCLEIPGCVQHKIMYGVALWRDRSHYMDHMDRTHHNVEMLVASILRYLEVQKH